MHFIESSQATYNNNKKTSIVITDNMVAHHMRQKYSQWHYQSTRFKEVSASYDPHEWWNMDADK